MAASHVQHKLARGGGVSTIAATFDGSVVAANALSAFIRWTDSPTLNSVIDSLLNTHTLIHNPVTGVTANKAAMAHFVNLPSGGACIVTATFSAAPGETDLLVHESTGTGLIFDASDLTSGGDLGSGTDAWDPACAATFTAGAVLNAFTADEGYGETWTAGTGYTVRVNVSEVASETQVFGAGGALAAKFTAASGFIDAFVGILAFKESGGAAAPARVRSRMFMMGAG